MNTLELSMLKEALQNRDPEVEYLLQSHGWQRVIGDDEPLTTEEVDEGFKTALGLIQPLSRRPIVRLNRFQNAYRLCPNAVLIPEVIATHFGTNHPQSDVRTAVKYFNDDDRIPFVIEYVPGGYRLRRRPKN